MEEKVKHEIDDKRTLKLIYKVGWGFIVPFTFYFEICFTFVLIIMNDSIEILGLFVRYKISYLA